MRVFDGHCDTASGAYWRGNGFRRNEGQLDLERMVQVGSWAQFFAIFGVRPREGQTLWEIFQGQYATFQKEMEANADIVVQCRTADEVEAAWEQGKQAAILSVEGAGLLDCNIAKLEEAYRLGVRAVNITWNFENELSGSNVEGKEKGLTEKGKAFVKRMQELGMLVDVSHISDPAFWDIAEIAQKPFFASHSNSRAVCPHSRNLTDEQFSAIIKIGGTAGLNMLDEFVGEDPDVDSLVRHVEHWCSLGGERAVALGGDWDGIDKWPKGIDGIQDIHKLADRLLQLNYKEEIVDGIFYKNLMRVVREVCTT